ncbi:flagellar hook-basal body complex protein [Nocardioides sp.]|uniref:flagellar hook-basal body complex protein n=1 Tax=Nocardioides sp. TaxID=35761 RepID=UPI002735F5D8|nr:flagellar hook-basal body complex protein [Nocardioides sp.]MDP3890248.1 flagellar hook-basal body complex protein [Nocardioides sp.]
MSIPGTEAVTAGLFNPAGGASTTTAQSADKSMFLQLLVAQLRYQDPLNPTDTSQFLSQTAQFNALEKMQEVADQTAQVLSTQMAFGAAGLVGQTVTYPGPDGNHVTGTVGSVTFGATGPVLDVDGTTVPLLEILGVGTPPVPSSTVPSSTVPSSTPDDHKTFTERTTTMLRSLNAGISGPRVNQTMLDVTGNNIANANTIGFKASSTVFQDTLSQMLTGAAGANAANGGRNPIQVGLGVQLAATSTNFNQGAAQTTGRATDLMIQGDGFFVVQKGTEQLYTRAGSFTFDETGTLVTPSGARVQGYALDAAGNRTGGLIDITLDTAGLGLPAGVELTSYNIGADGKLRGVFSDGVQRDMAQVAMADFNNPMGLEKVGETAFRASANSGAAQLGVAAEGRRGSLLGGAVEMSNVDLAAEFTNLILAQRGFQASSRVITTSDSVLEELVNIKR